MIVIIININNITVFLKKTFSLMGCNGTCSVWLLFSFHFSAAPCRMKWTTAVTLISITVLESTKGHIMFGWNCSVCSGCTQDSSWTFHLEFETNPGKTKEKKTLFFSLTKKCYRTVTKMYKMLIKLLFLRKEVLTVILPAYIVRGEKHLWQMSLWTLVYKWPSHGKRVIYRKCGWCW